MSEAVVRDPRPADGLAPAARLGGELRARRQSLGWQLPDLAGSLRIRQTYLEAIEAGRMSELPGTTYALGFVRAYASALGLPGEQVASRFRAETAEASLRPTLSFPAPVPQRGVPAGALLLLGLLILAGAYSGWYYVSEHQRTPAQTVPPIPDRLLPPETQKSAPSPQVASIMPGTAAPSTPPASPLPAPARPPVAAPVAAPAQAQAPGSQAPAPTPAAPAPGALATTQPGTPVAAPSAPLPLPAIQTPSSAPAPIIQPPPAAAAVPPALPSGTRILVKATADAWVTVKQKGGPPLLNKLMHAGDSWPVPADKTGLTLTTGNAGGTALDIDGKPIPNLGASGMVRRDLPLDADALKSAPLPPIPHARKPPPPPAAQ
jgi:cytoskeleton protein RodZ